MDTLSKDYERQKQQMVSIKEQLKSKDEIQKEMKGQLSIKNDEIKIKDKEIKHLENEIAKLKL